jgi:hypothetical protein
MSHGLAPRRRSLRFAALAGVLALAALAPAGAQQPHLDELLQRISERISEFYDRAKNVICIERSSVQAVDLDNSPVGFVRTVESELHLETRTDQNPDEATFVRTIRKVNGRAPREKDAKDRAGCTDPNPLTDEPLAFLLAAHRSAYVFSVAGMGRDRNRSTLMIDFESVNRRSNPTLIEAPSGHDDCFDWTGHIASKGRVWVDAATYDVIRVEKRLRGPVDVRVPALIQRRHRIEPFVMLMRDDMTIRYNTVAFSNPQEVLLLPESIDIFTVVRGGLQSTRRNQTFSDYRRFVAEGKVLP